MRAARTLAARSGDSWRRRWDSLELFSAARYSSLPGVPFSGDPEHFPGKDAVADYLENYARTHELPIRHDSRVTSLEPSSAQIAEDLAPTHRVHLSRGARIPRLPRRLLGKSVHFYGDHLGLIAAPLDSWRGSEIGRCLIARTSSHGTVTRYNGPGRDKARLSGVIGRQATRPALTPEICAASQSSTKRCPGHHGAAVRAGAGQAGCGTRTRDRTPTGAVWSGGRGIRRLRGRGR
jgi:hypothetical protein